MHRNGWMPSLRESQIRKRPKVVVKLDGCQPYVNPNKEMTKSGCQTASSWMGASYMQIPNKETIKSGQSELDGCQLWNRQRATVQKRKRWVKLASSAQAPKAQLEISEGHVDKTRVASRNWMGASYGNDKQKRKVGRSQLCAGLKSGT